MAAVNDTGSYKFTPEFENCGVDLSNLELSSDWDAAAKAITTWLEKQPGIAPCAIGTSAANGTASFSQLKPGLYLVSSASAVQGSYRYSTAPCLIAVPHLNAQETAWNYQVTSHPKIEQTPASAEDPSASNSAAENGSEQDTQNGPLGSPLKTGNYTAPLTVAVLALIATLATLFAYQQRKKQLAATAASSALRAATGANPSPEGTQHATGEASLEEEIEEAPLPSISMDRRTCVPRP